MLLPLELIDTICEHSSPSTLKALRLTSRICQPSAEKFLFAVIYLKFDQDSKERQGILQDSQRSAGSSAIFITIHGS
jgi:hypothetical protein